MGAEAGARAARSTLRANSDRGENGRWTAGRPGSGAGPVRSGGTALPATSRTVPLHLFYRPHRSFLQTARRSEPRSTLVPEATIPYVARDPDAPTQIRPRPSMARFSANSPLRAPEPESRDSHTAPGPAAFRSNCGQTADAVCTASPRVRQLSAWLRRPKDDRRLRADVFAVYRGTGLGGST
jgi:hypothetical protein